MAIWNVQVAQYMPIGISNSVGQSNKPKPLVADMVIKKYNSVTRRYKK